MSDFLESAKNFVNSAVSRTGWEAQKQLRMRNKQSEVDKLLQQRQQLLGDLSQVAMTLYKQGTLSDPQLSRVCASIFELDHDLKTRETQLQEIKDEPYPVSQMSPSPITNLCTTTQFSIVSVDFAKQFANWVTGAGNAEVPTMWQSSSI